MESGRTTDEIVSAHVRCHFDHRHADFLPFVQGRQGIVGLVVPRRKHRRRSETSSLRFVAKTSSHATFVGAHEYYVLKSLNALRLPFFPAAIGLGLAPVALHRTSRENEYRRVFDVAPHVGHVSVDVCLSQYMSGTVKCTSVVRDTAFSDTALASMARLVFEAMRLAYAHNRTCHFDIHPNNILVNRCDPDTVFVFDNTVIPTHGLLPRVIDFGFAYCDDLKGHALTGPCEFFDKGYMPENEPYADVRVFLQSFAFEVAQSRPESRMGVVLEEFADRLFGNTDLIRRQNGWMKLEARRFAPAKLLVANLLACAGIDAKCMFLNISSHRLLHVAQLLVGVCRYPLSDWMDPGMPIDILAAKMKRNLTGIAVEYAAIESDIVRSREDMLAVFRALAENAVRARLALRNDGMDRAVRVFSNGMFDALRALKPFYNVLGSKANMSRLLSETLSVVAPIETLLHRELVCRRRAMHAAYMECGLPVKGAAADKARHAIVDALHVHMHTPYVYTQNTMAIRFSADGKHRAMRLDADTAAAANATANSTRARLRDGAVAKVLAQAFDSGHCSASDVADWNTVLGVVAARTPADDEENGQSPAGPKETTLYGEFDYTCSPFGAAAAAAAAAAPADWAGNIAPELVPTRDVPPRRWSAK